MVLSYPSLVFDGQRRWVAVFQMCGLFQMCGHKGAEQEIINSSFLPWIEILLYCAQCVLKEFLLVFLDPTL